MYILLTDWRIVGLCVTSLVGVYRVLFLASLGKSLTLSSRKKVLLAGGAEVATGALLTIVFSHVSAVSMGLSALAFLLDLSSATHDYTFRKGFNFCRLFSMYIYLIAAVSGIVAFRTG